MVVDDEEDITLTLKIGLQHHGFAVTSFNDPLIALSSFKADQYDLLLLDIKMPHMDGFELHQKLKEIDSKVKVCFMTAFEVYFESLKELYPDSYLDVCFIKKPFSLIDFARKISEEIARRAADAE
jgi:DNA-binding response OmpR family regulator